MHLVDHARAYIEETYSRAWHDRAIRSVLAWVLPFPRRFRAALVAARLGRPFRGLMGIVPAFGPRLKAMLDLAPRRLPANSAPSTGTVFPAEGQRRKRVVLLANCTQPVLDPGINAATIRLLNRLGVEVVMAKGETCCGALVHHMGDVAGSHRFAAANIDAWTKEIDGEGLDAIVITASGCGTTIKDYGFMFRNDGRLADKAAKVSSLAMDVTEFLESLDMPAPASDTGLVVAYHSACSMQHGQQLKDGPKRLLKAAGFEVRDVPEGHICCGSAGTYNILQPAIATQLRDRKVDNIALTQPDVIATGNIGCIVQIGNGLAARGGSTPIVHTAELLDWATGGPRPAALAGVESSRRQLQAPEAAKQEASAAI
jgi:glycolate oxidase iron-sulfur subunit